MRDPVRNRAVRPPWWHLYVPKTYTVLRQGYDLGTLRHDVIAGLTVAIVAMPLGMALAIASGTTPANGLITVVIAGLLISLLSGCRFQVGGPAGAFVVIVWHIIAVHGYDGLVLATLMAGLMLVGAGLMRLGDWIKYIPQPVVTGFTAGIALLIFSSQVRDIFGLQMAAVPGDFIDKWQAFWAARGSVSLEALAISGGALALLIALRRLAPKMPAMLLAIVVPALVVWWAGLEVPTIGSAFGGIPRALPVPHWPVITFERLQALLPSAFTIAFLSGVESLLCAVVADGMSGRRHKSNCELVAQGVANVGSALFGGMPATGTVARTATNIRAGARTPVAGMLHALFVLSAMVLFAPLAAWIPLASLAAVLVVVAWNMSEKEMFLMLLRGPRGDAMVLVTTFLLTVFVDLTVAIEAGVVLAAILFMHRMAQAVEMETGEKIIHGDADDVTGAAAGDDNGMRAALPPGVEAFQVQGPLFFGVAGRLIDALDQIRPAPQVFIVRLGQVPMIDASGVVALMEFIRRCQAQGTQVILSRARAEVLAVIRSVTGHGLPEGVILAGDFSDAVTRAGACQAGRPGLSPARR